MKKKLSVVILDFQKAEKVVRNVGALLEQKTNFEFEIIVADNSNDEKNAKILRENLGQKKSVRLIINDQNFGYSRGNNLAAKEAGGEFLAILNPDIFCKDENILQSLLDYLEKNPDVGIVGPAQIDESSGAAEITARRWPRVWVQVLRRTPLRSLPLVRDHIARDECADLDLSRVQEVDWLQSSFVVLRRDFFDQIGKFDQRYFLFLADTQMGWRAWEMGKKVIFFPKVRVFADGIRCSRGGILDFFRSRVLRIHVFDALKFALFHLFARRPRAR